jgi:3-methylcrotonyl-CoA carboxylase alpha subunit
MEYRYQVGGDVKSVRIERDGDHIKVMIGDKPYAVDVKSIKEGEITFTIDGKHWQAFTARDGAQTIVAFDATTYTLEKAETGKRRTSTQGGANTLAAAMPGQVTKVLVAEGDTIKRGQTLIILEAMKMEIRVTAPEDGQVVKVLCRAGEIVERGQRLVELSVA